MTFTGKRVLNYSKASRRWGLSMKLSKFNFGSMLFSSYATIRKKSIENMGFSFKFAPRGEGIWRAADDSEELEMTILLVDKG